MMAIGLSELIDMATRLIGASDSKMIAADGMANVLSYVVESEAWDNTVRQSVQQVSTNEGPRIARVVDARRIDRTAGISLIAIDNKDGSVSHEVNIGDFHSTFPFMVFRPITDADWRVILAAFKAYDDEVSASKNDAADAADNRHPFAMLRDLMNLQNNGDGSHPLMDAFRRMANEEPPAEGEKSCAVCSMRIPPNCNCGQCHRCEAPHN
jgi:hypothetical protein